ncbi:sugar phosphate nucleotidyltransferase [Blattabacterium cuenoti]|uniref:sugar phosphate nucleotidyltransferase n=1 Tax=Blattabacterium cuenoti TaxID=1653831 RepID=UPI00163CAFF2|nr:sugar phosphate nucleotidyltransferase [Blattabacterium cuenoti]
MKIIIPMAGEGSRLRPHTLNTLKPLISIAGRSILKRLLENLSQSIFSISIKEIIFIIGNVGKKIENQLINIANDIGLDGIIYYQDKPLGTADALLKAKDSLKGPTIVAFSDTLFYNHDHFEKINFDNNIIWTKKVKNPSLFGIVKCDPSTGLITHFIEKPKKNIVSDLAIIGIYYFKNSSILKKELQYILDHDIKNEEEYQLTSALENMRKKGERFIIQKVQEWMDFGNKKRTISSNSKILSIESNKFELIHKKSTLKNSLIIKPCFIGEKAIIENSIIGPYVSIGKYTKIKNSKIEKSLIQDYTEVRQANLFNSMIGNHTIYIGKAKEVNLGDYSQFFY